MIELFWTFIVNILSICQVVLCLCALSGTKMKKKKKKLLIFFLNVEKKVIIMCVFLIFYFIEEIILLNYNLDVIFFLVPNCPLYNVGAKLSWCQIVRCQIVLVPNCPGPKLSGAKLSGAKLSYNPFMDITTPCADIFLRMPPIDHRYSIEILRCV